MNNLKNILLFLYHFLLFANLGVGQNNNLGPLEAGISITGSNTVSVSFKNTSGSSLTGESTSIIVYLRVPLTGSNNPSVSFMDNPFNLTRSNEFDFSGFRYFGFEVFSNISLTEFLNDVERNVLGLEVTDGASVELVGGEFAPFNNGTNIVYTGAAITTGPSFDTNLVTWPITAEANLLPIKLNSFVAEKYSNTSSLLTWETVTEVNASHIEIERSRDAEVWEKIGTIQAKGGKIATTYNFIDESLPLSRGANDIFYYKLKSIDLDGSHEYSQIRSVSFDGKVLTSFEVYPNPAVDQIFVEMSSPDNLKPTTKLHVFDTSGRLVKSQDISTNGISPVDMGDMTKSIYLFKITQNDEQIIKKVIKVD